jgi:hypothetical protein
LEITVGIAVGITVGIAVRITVGIAVEIAAGLPVGVIVAYCEPHMFAVTLLVSLELSVAFGGPPLRVIVAPGGHHADSCRVVRDVLVNA